MLARRLRLSLVATQIVAALTLLRSVAFDRWITVLAALVLFGGAYAAQRGKTWGIGVALGSALSFPVAWMIGIAPPWFGLVGLVGVLPFLITSRVLARFDLRATAVGAAMAAGVGGLAAILWGRYAFDVFAAFPILTPSFHANHPFVVTLLALGGFLAARGALARANSDGADASGAAARVRVDAGTGLRVESTSSELAFDDDLAEADRDLDADLNAPRRASGSRPSG